MAKGKARITISGYDAILKSIEKMGGDMQAAAIEAVELSGKNATNRFRAVAQEHEYSGLTLNSLVDDPKAAVKKGKIILDTGFDINKGGVAAIWLDRGTPKQKPLNYVSKIKKDQAVKGAIGYVLGKKWREML